MDFAQTVKGGLLCIGLVATAKARAVGVSEVDKTSRVSCQAQGDKPGPLGFGDHHPHPMHRCIPCCNSGGIAVSGDSTLGILSRLTQLLTLLG